MITQKYMNYLQYHIETNIFNHPYIDVKPLRYKGTYLSSIILFLIHNLNILGYEVLMRGYVHLIPS